MRGTLHGKTLRFERRLGHPIERVWRVLTDEAETAYWFPGRIVGAREAGAPVQFIFEAKPAGVMDASLAALIASKQAAFANAAPEDFAGRIVTFEPPRLFELTWGGDQLRFELTSEGEVTRLVFTHTFVEHGGAEVAAGWHVSLDWLESRLSGSAPPTTLADFQAIEQSYQREAI